jgi:hypothetical protein
METLTKYLKIALLAVTLASPALANSEAGIYFAAGDGKLLGGYLRSFVYEPIFLQGDFGGYVPVNLAYGDVNQFIGMSAGAKIVTHGMYLAFSHGVTTFYNNDWRVSAGLNFLTRFSAGLQADGFHLGYVFTHVSNGGMRPGNFGRDWQGVEFGFKW